MRAEAKADRKDEIMAAAYQVMDAKGYAGLSMLAVARAAKASNETLYRWYGDKTGLFTALISHNSRIVADALAGGHSKTPMEDLARIGPVLLTMLLGPHAVALNRAAAADTTGTLGAALSSAGRETVKPWLEAVMSQALTAGMLGGADPAEMTESYLSNLIGDLQIRRVTGAMPMLTKPQIQTRADTALTRMRVLFPPNTP